MATTDFIPIDNWGRDHWSTLLYVETRLVDGDGFKVEFDPRMRSNRRHFRLLSSKSPTNKRIGQPMDQANGSRLADGTVAADHDDWFCLQDMVAAGLFKGDMEKWDIGFKFQFTEYGYSIIAALRKHKAEGGNTSDFWQTYSKK